MIIIGQVSGKESYEAHFEVSFKDSQEFNKQYFAHISNPIPANSQNKDF
jgi:hypothetical protein